MSNHSNDAKLNPGCYSFANILVVSMSTIYKGIGVLVYTMLTCFLCGRFGNN